MTTNTRLMLVLLERTESDDAEESGVYTQGEPVRARPIRNVRPKAVDAFHPESAFASLARWVGKVGT